MKKISIKTVAIVAIALTTVVFTFSPYLYAGDSPLPLNPDPEDYGSWYSRVTGYTVSDANSPYQAPFVDLIPGVGGDYPCDPPVRGGVPRTCLIYVGP